MSDVHATPAAVAVPASETVPTPAAESVPVIAATEAPAAAKADEPVVAPETAAPSSGAVAAAEAAPAAAALDTEEKPVEPVSEGVLGYKAPGLLKQFTFSKKDFWFSDEPVAIANLDSYLRGEKAETAYPVAAWASQTGKGLLFFVKKGETDKSRPAGVLPLYEVTDLKKSGDQEFSFRLNNQSHTFKAANDAERDGWYFAIEKSIEHGKASKESVVESEGYKTELEKITPPPVIVTAGGATIPAAAPAPKRSVELDSDTPRPDGSDNEDDLKNKPKSRSTSRGVLARLMSKRDDTETKVDEKKAEKEVENTPAAQTTTTEGPSEIEGAAIAGVMGIEEKPKPTKRTSIFGSLKTGFKSPIKEKDFKDAELKQDAAVSDVAPQLPETTATTTPAIAEPVAPAAAATTVDTTEPKVESDAVNGAEVVTPSREKKSFLSGFLPKRDRSVSPSAPVKDAQLTETPEASVETPVVSSEEAKAEEPAPANRRQSVFGGLGRRASKMMSRVQSSKKETPTESMAGEATETTATPITEDLAAHEATEPIVENKPEPVATTSGSAVAASA